MIDQQKTLWPIAHLFHWNRNPRTITPEDKERLKQQVIDLGQYKPLIITSDGEVLGGNMRLDIYKELGFTEAWVSIVVAETDADKVKYALSDNDRAGTYDEEQLAKLIQDLGVDINLEDYKVDLGDAMTLSQVLEQIRNEREITEDEAPPVSQDPAISLLGEVYQLGRHRLMCGDSTKIEDVERLMDGQKADMVFTDPPYGIEIVQGASIGGSKPTAFGSVGGGKIAKVHQYSSIIGDNTTQTAKDAYSLCVSLGIEKQIFWGGNYFTDFLHPSPCWLIWNKKNTGNFADVEMAWTNFKTGARLYDFLWNGLSREGDRASELVSRVHPTQKPVGLHASIIKDYSEEDSVIIDLFGGSGSTLIAAEQTNRTCYMMELDPKYCDVIRKRYAKFIGGEDEWETITPKL